MLRVVPPADLLPALAAALDGGPAVVPEVAPEVLAALRPDEPLEHDDVALVVPTSGSTGEPKGVLLTAGNLRSSALATADRLGGHGQWLLAIPPTHVGGLQVLVRSLLAGTTPVVLPPGPFEAAAFAEATARLTGGAPVRLARADPAAPPAAPTRTRCGRTTPCCSAGPPHPRRCSTAPARPACAWSRRTACRRRAAAASTTACRSTACGCEVDGGRVRLGGPVVARGYRLRPDLTAAAFAGDVFTTSDLGRLDGGVLTVLGRADDVLVSGGENVAPLAVEAALEAHPSVVEAAVTGVPDDEWGTRVVALVVLRAPLTLAEARDHVAAVLPRSWAPRALREVEALPLLASGKLDRAALRWSADMTTPSPT